MPEFTSYAHGTPCWVDVTSPDLDGTIAFYSGLFGWEAERDPRPEAGGYTMFTKNGKHVAAGSPPQQEGMPAYWTTYIASDDVDATAAKIRDAGGTLMMDPFDVFDAGRMTIAQDPTGATFGVWQAGEHIGAQLANEPGTLLWNQCQTPDPARAAEFYQAVFGYEIDEIDLGGEQPFRVLQVAGRGIGGVREPASEGVPPHWSATFAVADVDETVSRARELGGTVLMEPLDLPDIGRLAVLQDPAGAVFQVMASAGEPPAPPSLELAVQHGGDGPQRDAGVRELGLSGRQPLQCETGEEQAAEEAGGVLHRLPELHRDADRDDRDEGAGQRGRQDARRQAVDDAR